MVAVMARETAFHEWFRAKFRESGLSPTAYAEMVGLNHLTVLGWLDQGKMPQRKTIQRLADYYRTDVDDLLSKAGYGTGRRRVDDASPSLDPPGILLFGGGEHLTPEQKDELARRLQKTIDDYLADQRKRD